mmetsp:Transcript_8969/g.17669  ORF Transcript_8969/g.17669 Transcript_8969/m.17669 type:complete len:721 (-) Transcript_8969:1785-3947(-)
MVSSEPVLSSTSAATTSKSSEANSKTMEDQLATSTSTTQEDINNDNATRPISPTGSGSGGYSSDSSAEAVDVSKLDPATLKARIKAQVEYYFSQQNLNRDAYMISQMDSDGFIPVSVIANFRKVSKLTDSEEMIADAIADSTICQLSEDKSKIKTLWKRPARTTIILREVPEDTKEEDIQSLFQDTEFAVQSVRSEVGQSWFVTMETEEDAKNAVIHLIGKTLHGQAVKARLKSEAIRPLPQIVQQYGAVPPGSYAPYYGYGNMVNYSQVQNWGYQVDPSQAQQAGSANASQGGAGNRANRSMSGKYSGSSGSQRQGRGAGNSSGDRRRSTSATASGSGSQYGDAQSYSYASGTGSRGGSRRAGAPGSSQNRKKSNKGPSNSTQQGPGAKRQGSVQAKPPVFKPQDFPSLSGRKSVSDEKKPSIDAEVSPEIPAGETPVVEQQQEQQQASVTTSESDAQKTSWAAAVAKAPPTPRPTPAASAPASSKDAPAEQQQSQETQQPSGNTQDKSPSPSRSSPEQTTPAKDVGEGAASAGAASGSTVSSLASEGATGVRNGFDKPAERPKRGWEKPGMISKAKVSDVKEIVSDVIDSATEEVEDEVVESVKQQKSAQAQPAAGQDEQAEEAEEGQQAQEKSEVNASGAKDESSDSSAGNASWGAKKSFADIIKSKPTAQQTTTLAPAQAPAAIAAVSKPNLVSTGSKSDGNWRSSQQPPSRPGRQ